MGLGDSLEARVTFFSQEICDGADTAFRYAFILTLDRNLAHRCVKDAFTLLARDVDEIDLQSNINEIMAGACWEAYQGMGANSVKIPGTSHEVSDAVCNLDPVVRAAIGAVDFMGLTIDSTTKALGVSEYSLRESLASGRKALLASSLAS